MIGLWSLHNHPQQVTLDNQIQMFMQLGNGYWYKPGSVTTESNNKLSLPTGEMYVPLPASFMSHLLLSLSL